MRPLPVGSNGTRSNNRCSCSVAPCEGPGEFAARRLKLPRKTFYGQAGRIRDSSQRLFGLGCADFRTTAVRSVRLSATDQVG